MKSKNLDDEVFASAEIHEPRDGTDQAQSLMTTPLESEAGDRLSLGMSTGVLFGGILGLMLIAFINGPINQTIAIAVCMALGTIMGAIVSPMLPA